MKIIGKFQIFLFQKVVIAYVLSWMSTARMFINFKFIFLHSFHNFTPAPKYLLELNVFTELINNFHVLRKM